MKTEHLPKTDSIQELAQFWATHDLTDFEDELEEVLPVFEPFDPSRSIPLAQRSEVTKNQISPSCISIYLTDFAQSRKFAKYVLDRNLPAKKSPQLRLIHLAFNTSLIVSYSRPFTGNKNSEGEIERSPLKELVAEVLNQDEQKIHDNVVGYRHSTYAHSDARVHLIPGFSDRSGFPRFMADPFYALLSESETAILRTMIGKWIRYLRKEKANLKCITTGSQ